MYQIQYDSGANAKVEPVQSLSILSTLTLTLIDCFHWDSVFQPENLQSPVYTVLLSEIGSEHYYVFFVTAIFNRHETVPETLDHIDLYRVCGTCTVHNMEGGDLWMDKNMRYMGVTRKCDSGNNYYNIA